MQGRSSRETLKQLRTICAELVPDPAGVRSILYDVGMHPERFRIHDAPIEQIWVQVLQEAERQGFMLEAVTAELLHLYPGRTDLRSIYHTVSGLHGYQRDRNPTMTSDGWPEPPFMMSPYKLLQRLDGGGAGIVYSAILEPDTKEGARLPPLRVAIKLLRPRHLKREQYQLFLDEMHLLAQLSHPNVVRIHRVGKLYDFGKGDVPFIEMELIRSGSLERLLNCADLERDRYARAPIQAVRLARALASALDYLHNTHEYVHLDLKPSNILLDGDIPKLADFGLARRYRQLDGATQSSGGSLGYASPEQIDDEPLDHRSDLFSLGALLWRTVGGTWPPPGPLPFTNRVPWLEHADLERSPHFGTLDEGLQKLLLRLTEPDKKKRPDSAREVITACDRLIEELTVAPHRKAWEERLQCELEAARMVYQADVSRHLNQELELTRLREKLAVFEEVGDDRSKVQEQRWNEERVQLEAEITLQRDEVRSVSSELQQSSLQRDALTAELVALRAESASRMKSMEAERRDFISRTEALEAEVQQSLAHRHWLELERQKAAERLSLTEQQYQQQLDKAEDRLSQAELERRQSAEEIKKLEREFLGASERLTRRISAHAETEHELAQVIQQLVEAKARVAHLEGELKQSTERFAQVELERLKSNEHIARLEREVEQSTERFSQTEIERRKSDERLLHLERELQLSAERFSLVEVARRRAEERLSQLDSTYDEPRTSSSEATAKEAEVRAKREQVSENEQYGDGWNLDGDGYSVKRERTSEHNTWSNDRLNPVQETSVQGQHNLPGTLLLIAGLLIALLLLVVASTAVR